jgi:AhpD family alkylhydroperoxidase
MTDRIRYAEVVPAGVKHLNGLSLFLTNSESLDEGLRALVELRVSQINGCAYCCVLHTREARKNDVPQRQLDTVAAWREATGEFTDAERAALDWAEAMTLLAPGGPPDDVYEELLRHYDEVTATQLSLAIALMNTYNRLAVSFHSPLPE